MSTKHGKRTQALPHPRMTVQALSQSAILDSLRGPELVVYLRLVGACGIQRSRRVHVVNADLYRNVRTAVSALRALEDKGLIKIDYDNAGAVNRMIEVSR